MLDTCLGRPAADVRITLQARRANGRAVGALHAGRTAVNMLQLTSVVLPCHCLPLLTLYLLQRQAPGSRTAWETLGTKNTNKDGRIPGAAASLPCPC